jgi:hypothetical protein
MRTITISDKTTTGVLSFDLRDLLQLIGELTTHLQWVVMDHVECTGPRANDLEGLGASGGRVGMRELMIIAMGIEQVIEGEFHGYEAEQSSPTILLRAVDSSSWDIASTNDELLELFRKRFTEVYEAGDAY